MPCLFSQQNDTVWELSGSPYVITEPITVLNATTLTIEAGVKVFFTQPAAKLLVEGALSFFAIEVV